MCCESGRMRRGFEAWGPHSSCCGPRRERSFRRFVSAKEEQEQLEEYRDELQKELSGVEERIQELKSK